MGDKTYSLTCQRKMDQQAAFILQRSKMEKHMRDTVSAVLTELCLEGKLCDVVIKVGDIQFDAHKIILCSCSSYFRTLFTGAWATSKKQMYSIPGVLPHMMQIIINYAYTHTVPVTEGNVAEVLAAADQFLVPGITQTCCLFLEDQLCLKNCIGIWRLVDFYYCPEMRDKVLFYILHHFEKIVGVSQELLELPVQQLVTIIENDHLNVKHEDTVFQTILHWINYLPDQRRGHLPVLLPRVRLGLMTASYLKNNVINNALIKDNTECIRIIDDAVTAFIDFRSNRHSQAARGNPLNRPRLPPAILLIIGGKDGNYCATRPEVYDSRTDCWVTVSIENIYRTDHGAAVLNNFVYLIGGNNHEGYLNTVQKFDLVTCTWHQVAPMNSCRCFVSVSVQNGCIYAMGGFDGRKYYNTAECYKPEIDKWVMIAPMHAKRCGASAATLNGKVYICGGYNGRRILCAAECYNPDVNQWTFIAPMRSCRSGLGVVAYKDHIYAVGGIAFGTTCLRSAEAYNPQTNRWSIMPSMHNTRSYFGIEVVDDQIFVVGGYNGSTAMFSVERYDDDAGMWYSASNTAMPHTGMSCCVLHGLHSVAETLFPRDVLMPADATGGPSDPSAQYRSMMTDIKCHY